MTAPIDKADPMIEPCCPVGARSPYVSLELVKTCPMSGAKQKRRTTAMSGADIEARPFLFPAVCEEAAPIPVPHLNRVFVSKMYLFITRLCEEYLFQAFPFVLILERTKRSFVKLFAVIDYTDLITELLRHLQNMCGENNSFAC